MGQQIPACPGGNRLVPGMGATGKAGVRVVGFTTSSADALTRLTTGVADRFHVWMRDGKKKAFGPFPAES